MDRRLVLLFAVACGASVANLYYAQPLLDRIARDLDVSPGAAGLLVTASQIGYALGLITIVPLGDFIARHRLVVPLMVTCTLALLGAAAAPDLAWLLAAVLLVGLTAVLAQVLVPLAGAMADDRERGRIVGTVMSGYDGHRGWIYSLGVHPDARRQGIASILLARAEAELAAAGCPKINLQVMAGNERALAFWSAAGYATDQVVSLGKRL
jgi:ribosomal protein S18 acetylase RimI-like enzyme